jgi:hypothetical protein
MQPTNKFDRRDQPTNYVSHQSTDARRQPVSRPMRDNDVNRPMKDVRRPIAMRSVNRPMPTVSRPMRARWQPTYM